MFSMSFHKVLRLCLGSLVSALPALAQPVAGFKEYTCEFKIQRPYNIPVDERFRDSSGIYTTKVFPSDKPFEPGNTTEPRTEMRWETWTDQKAEHMFEADVMYEDGCARTCIHQVKSNTSGEALYLRVLDGGDLIVLNDGATVVKNGYGTWFHLRTAYNPSNGQARIWINGELKHSFHSSGRDWYFKNGTYTVEGKGPAVAHFKNIKMQVADNSTTGVAPSLNPSRAGRSGKAVLLGGGASILPLGAEGWGSTFDLSGKAVLQARAGVYFGNAASR
jgi:hypothetical protein